MRDSRRSGVSDPRENGNQQSPHMRGSTLVTGATGFIGRHLVDFLRRHSEGEIICGSRTAGNGAVRLDLSDPDEIHHAIGQIEPTRVFHCAGAFTNQWESDFPANVEWTRSLLESVRVLAPTCRVLLIGSAAEYGHPPPGAVAETAPLRPVSVYGITKAMQTMLMEYFHRSSGMDIVMARTFNLFGPGCPSNLFPGRVAEQIERIQRGMQDKIELCSLTSRRDYLHVSDAVRSYARIMEHGKPGEIYNVGSGAPVKMLDLLKKILREAGFPMAAVTSSAKHHSKTNVPEIYADIRKLNALAT